jgi:hypothetical protein
VDADRAPSALSTRNVLGGSFAVLGLASLGVGVGYLIDSLNKSAAAQDYDAGVRGGACAEPSLPSCDDYNARRDRASSSRAVSWLGFGGAALFTTGAVLTFALWPTSTATRTATPFRPRFITSGNTVGLFADF